MFRVLMPVDNDEERALAAAETVASIPNAPEEIEVTLLNVETELDVSDGGGRVRSEEWYDESDFPPSVDRTVDYLAKRDIDVEARRAHADPADAIVSVANEIDADRIVMSGRKRTPAGKVLFGSVTQSVLLSADVPVTVSMH